MKVPQVKFIFPGFCFLVAAFAIFAPCSTTYLKFSAPTHVFVLMKTPYRSWK